MITAVSEWASERRGKDARGRRMNGFVTGDEIYRLGCGGSGAWATNDPAAEFTGQFLSSSSSSSSSSSLSLSLFTLDGNGTVTFQSALYSPRNIYIYKLIYTYRCDDIALRLPVKETGGGRGDGWPEAVDRGAVGRWRVAGGGWPVSVCQRRVAGGGWPGASDADGWFGERARSFAIRFHR